MGGKMKKHQTGEMLLEYTIIVALIALVCLPAFQALGDAVYIAALQVLYEITNQ